jgi:hypothetical protein
MVDLTITATNVIAGSNATKEQGVAGEVIVAGKVLAKATTGLLMLCDNNSATPEIRKPVGIALNGAAINQPVQFVTRGDVTIGAAVAAGETYFTSGAPGGIAVEGDNVAGMYPSVLGMAKSTTVITLDIQYPSVVI